MSDIQNPQDEFEILGRLGVGSMGVVQLARDRKQGGLVALKHLGSCDDRALSEAKLAREGEALKRLDHEGIVKYLGILRIDGQLVVVQEYVDGMTFRQWFDRSLKREEGAQTLDPVMMFPDIPQAGSKVPWSWVEAKTQPDQDHRFEPDDPPVPIPPVTRRLLQSPEHIRRCCEIVKQAAEALGQAHQRGVIHRDLKPENLMIGRDGKVRIIDFGLARYEGAESLSRTRAILGTPLYMSPEHIAGRINVDARSDIFSLGLVLYEALSLHCPYDIRSEPDLYKQILTRPMPPLTWKNPGVEELLEAIVHKAISKDPQQRYLDGVAFAKDLANYLDKDVVKVLPYRFKPDYREIVADRPANIGRSSLLFFLMGGLFLLMCVAGTTLLYSDPSTRYEVASYGAYSLFVGLSVIAFALGMGLRHANELAIRTAPFAGVALSLGTLFWLVRELVSPTFNLFDVILSSTLIGVGGYVGWSFVTSRSKVRQWATNAQYIRSQQTQPSEPGL